MFRCLRRFISSLLEWWSEGRGPGDTSSTPRPLGSLFRQCSPPYANRLRIEAADPDTVGIRALDRVVHDVSRIHDPDESETRVRADHPFAAGVLKIEERGVGILVRHASSR